MFLKMLGLFLFIENIFEVIILILILKWGNDWLRYELLCINGKGIL